MNTVEVKASRSYRVEIGRALLDTAGEKAAALTSGRSAAIISDDTVSALYGAQVSASLSAAGFAVCSFVFPHGEASKNGGTFLEIQDFLAKNHLTRPDLIVALGGGVVGDMAGFCAATYQRGIQFIQIPTTLLAMVDSSVGGKTAIDLPSGKNLCGAFCQPSLVLCDADCLKSLPREQFVSGCAEVIKYGVLGSRELFELLKAGAEAQDWVDIITRCVAMKRDIVEADEFDNGRRQFLNLGHTLGHAIEANSGFTLSHGQSVSIGLAMMARAAAKFGFCESATAEEIVALLNAYGLPVSTRQSAGEICAAAGSDKKRRGARINLIVPCDIGICRAESIELDRLPDWVEAGY